MEKYFTAIFLMLIILINGCTSRERKGWNNYMEKIKGKTEETISSDTLTSNDLTLSEQQQKLLNLDTTVVEMTNIKKILEEPGKIVIKPSNLIKINAPINGEITYISSGIGKPVKKGEIIAEIKNPENLGAVLKIFSPTKGTIVSSNYIEGEWTNVDNDLMEIGNFDSLEALINVFPDDIAKIKKRQSVEFNIGNITCTGNIYYVSPFVDNKTGTIEVRVKIVNYNSNLKVNDLITAEIILDRKPALVIPESSLLNEIGSYSVFIKHNNQFEKRRVEVGTRQGGIIEILNGLKEGDVVVSRGVYQLQNTLLNSGSSGQSEDGD